MEQAGLEGLPLLLSNLGFFSSGPVNPIRTSPKPVLPSSSSSSSSNSKPSLPSKLTNSDQNKPSTDDVGPTRKPETRTEGEVSEHVEICANTNPSDRKGGDTDTESNRNEFEDSLRIELEEPGNDKFRKVRMSNTKIREAIGDISGGVELLEHVGFVLKEGGGEMFAVMDVPIEERITLINRVLPLLEPGKTDDVKTGDGEKEEKVEKKKIDRQVNELFADICICILT
ncbi:hypothetical protein F3Y22_tig00117047pilonHSYRG00126 [Hibiscus syriacus]|uniref:PUB domain-containing protein n=1 Tax=Hibiscus syriacus TaxID=106335 RepID=A0A6A2W9V0_HIBSY|nr:hypothetical protein F3Y22_tig00117047pilonHSYRG00126 [Hibiscus syriacus]